MHILWDTSVKANEEDTDVTFDHAVLDNSCTPQPKRKLFKEQRNLSRKRDLKPVSLTDKRTERAKKPLWGRHGEEEEETKRSVMPQHVVEVDVEINIVDNGDCQKSSNPAEPGSKRKSTTPHGVRRKPCGSNIAAAADVPSSSPGGDKATNTVPSSPSQASIISESAAEELCNLRNYYSKQLRRINYISHEYLGQPVEPGMLACIREPLKSLRLPRRVTIAQTARSLWTRVSGRRTLVHR
ncbi:uncharacterized protein [Pempheris klunzingeri]|uniref:uncharacterized protein n=1 Tax=Pempheris klunzingeri TaxID=3127111 RepID=UPI00398096E7